MSELVVYNPKKNELSPLAFVKDAINQPKIRDISRYELTKQLGIICTTQMGYLGIKGTLSVIDKKDVLEMIQMRFKQLSLNEVEYAFRLERYGEYKHVNPKTKRLETDRTEHFQLFNSEYVSAVLDKYVIWKRERMHEHNIKALPVKRSVSEEEKKYWIALGVQNALKHYRESRELPENYVYVYDILYKDGLLPTDAGYKKKKMEEAKVAIAIQYEEKEVVSREEKNEVKKYLDAVRQDKHPIVITQAKKIVVMEYFKNLMQDEKKLESFNKRYSHGESRSKGSIKSQAKETD